MDEYYQISETQVEEVQVSPLLRAAFKRLPGGPDRQTVIEMRNELAWKATGQLVEKRNTGWRVALERKLRSKVGCLQAALLTELIFWTGKSAAPGGWLYKRREEFEDDEDGLGLARFEHEKARVVLRGVKTWRKQAFYLIEEVDVSRRTPNFYRVDLIAVAALLGITLESAPAEDEFDWEEDWDDVPFDESEALRVATRNGKGGESLRVATEALRVATEALHVAPLTEKTVRRDDRISSHSSGNGAVSPTPIPDESQKTPKEKLEKLYGPHYESEAQRNANEG